MSIRGFSCNARERGALCGADDCRTCHPENFDDDGRLMPVCVRCGTTVPAVDDSGICGVCAEEDAMKREESVESAPRGFFASICQAFKAAAHRFYGVEFNEWMDRRNENQEGR